VWSGKRRSRRLNHIAIIIQSDVSCQIDGWIVVVQASQEDRWARFGLDVDGSWTSRIAFTASATYTTPYYASRVDSFLAMPMPTHGFQIAEADTHEAVYWSNTHLRVQGKRRRVYRSAGDWVDMVDYRLALAYRTWFVAKR